MNFLEKIKKEIAREINKALNGKFVKALDFVYPPNKDMGDLSLPCFSLANKLGKNPIKVAGELVAKVSVGGIISGIKVIGPYANFSINKTKLAQGIIGEINKEKDGYGRNKSGKDEKVLIEYSNANTHKEYHVGHLRNICYGDAVSRILSANGYKSIPVSYINDFGIHTAKTLWAYLEFYKNKELPANKGRFLGEVYARSTKEIEKNKTAKQMIEGIMKKIESRKGKEYELWKETRGWSIKQFDNIYRELGVKFTRIFYESELMEIGRKMVDKLIKKGILELSQGAVIANFEKYDLGVLVVLRSDGTATYPVADIPLAIEKQKKFKAGKSIYVVDTRQILYFKQLFKILELLGHKEKLIHLGYDFVKLPSGMMSSRIGNVITYEDLREKLFEQARKETEKRRQDWSGKKIDAVASAIMNGAIKFEMVKVGANQEITFDIKKALSFQGFTAAYLQYTYARVNSIIKKAGEKENIKINFKGLDMKEEHELILKLAKYPEAVRQAGEKYDSAQIAKYLFELAQALNDYYHKVPVLKAEQEVRDMRLALIKSVNQVIRNGLDLLGIQTLDEM